MANQATVTFKRPQRCLRINKPVPFFQGCSLQQWSESPLFRGHPIHQPGVLLNVNLQTISTHQPLSDRKFRAPDPRSLPPHVHRSCTAPPHVAGSSGVARSLLCKDCSWDSQWTASVGLQTGSSLTLREATERVCSGPPDLRA